MNKTTQNNATSSGVPLRWAPSRIASAVILVLLIIGGIVFGTYSVVNNTPAPATPKSQSAPKSNNTMPPAKTSTPTAPTSPSTSNAGPTSTTSAAPNQLTNTGPGSAVYIVFASVTLLASALHYSYRWLRRRSTAEAL